jgi:hypothetical protein
MNSNVNKERARLARLQAINVMPLIGGLLDAWDDLPNDVKYDEELERLRKHIEKIDDGMEMD